MSPPPPRSHYPVAAATGVTIVALAVLYLVFWSVVPLGPPTFKELRVAVSVVGDNWVITVVIAQGRPSGPGADSTLITVKGPDGSTPLWATPLSALNLSIHHARYLGTIGGIDPGDRIVLSKAWYVEGSRVLLTFYDSDSQHVLADIRLKAH